MMQKISSRGRNAFTLIEIMVAAAITIIMVGLVIQITGEVLKLWNRSMGKLSANAEARIAMELLTNDLETALLINNGEQWLRVEQESNVGSPTTVGQTVGLKLFTPATDRPDGLGNVCAVGYRLAHARAYTGAKTDSFVLFRALESPKDTFDNLLGPGPNDPQKELTGNFWEPATITDPDNYLAGNIVDFKIYIYAEENGEQVVLNDRNEDGEIDLDYIYGGTGANSELLLFAEVMLTVVSDEGMEILALFADPEIDGAGTGYKDEDEVILQHGDVFKRRVNFQAKPF